MNLKYRKAFETLLQALRNKRVPKTPTAQRYDNKYKHIRNLQDIGVYLKIVK